MPLARLHTGISQSLAAATGPGGVNPPVPVGEGYTSRLRRTVAGLDVVNGLDRTLGKRTTIPQGERMRQRSKNLGNLATGATIGPLAGNSLGRMFSAYF